MSKVDDSDNQRIREMQEAEYRQRVDQEKRDAQARITKSFNEVMSQKSTNKIQKQAAQNKKTAEERDAKGKRIIDQAKAQQKDKKSASQLSRNAALSRAAQQGLLKSRASAGQEARLEGEQKTDEMTSKADTEKDRIDKEIDREDERDAIMTQEQQAEHRMHRDQPGDRVDPDGQNQQKQQQHERQREEHADAVSAAEGPRSAHAPRIPPDLIEKIVSRLFQAINPDGRTSLQMDLKGDGLEGVTLKIAAENGRVSCSFEGCSNELKAALRNGKSALQRGLAKRGMKLVALRIG